jgi:amino acid transporter
MTALLTVQSAFIFLAFFLELAFVISLAKRFPRVRGEKPFELWRALGIASIFGTTIVFVLTISLFGSR